MPGWIIRLSVRLAVFAAVRLEAWAEATRVERSRYCLPDAPVADARKSPARLAREAGLLRRSQRLDRWAGRLYDWRARRFPRGPREFAPEYADLYAEAVARSHAGLPGGRLWFDAGGYCRYDRGYRRTVDEGIGDVRVDGQPNGFKLSPGGVYGSAAPAGFTLNTFGRLHRVGGRG